MSLNRQPELSIFKDRMAVGALGALSRPLLDAFADRGIGKVDRNKSVNFCGMIRLANGDTSVFLPRSIPEPSLETAKLTMSALARFGHDATSRQFDDDGADGNPGLLAVVKRLADDFQHNGLFVERQQIRTRNNGKPDWKRTVSRERVFLDDEAGDYFPDIATTRSINSSENLIAQVQAVVLAEILEIHGWWLDGANARRAELRWQKRPHHSRELWALLLEGLLPRLYSARSIFLASYLGHYLRGFRQSAKGSLVFGVEDFHSVWEVMLRETLVGVERGWNERLPRARYEGVNGRSVTPLERVMLTDIVLRDDEGLRIVDAKYYDGTSEGSVPGWPDIAKQMFYEMAIRSIVGDAIQIRNSFVFPGCPANEKGFKRVVMRMPRNIAGDLKNFPEIECSYLPVTTVMEAYIARISCIRL